MKTKKEFSLAELGQGHPKGGTRVHCQNRQMMLERLGIRAPSLPLHLQAAWPAFKREYAEAFGRKHQERVGHAFAQVVRTCMEKLGEHLLSPEGDVVKPKGAERLGEKEAFAAFVVDGRQVIPKAASTLVV